MPQASYGHCAPLPRRNHQKDTIHNPGPQCMEWVKTNAASIGVKNRISPKMVQIDEHRGHHNEPGFPPMLLPDEPRKRKWHQQVKYVMDNISQKIDIAVQKLNNPFKSGMTPYFSAAKEPGRPQKTVTIRF